MGADPFEVFGGLDDPDEGEATAGDCSVGEAVDEVGDEGEDVRDADASGDQEDSAVGGERLG